MTDDVDPGESDGDGYIARDIVLAPRMAKATPWTAWCRRCGVKVCSYLPGDPPGATSIALARCNEHIGKCPKC
jgi:hypothetical protein